MKHRICYLEKLRVLACISVVFFHIFTTARTDFSNHSINEDYISILIPALLHFTVPIFFMITGYLFLNKKTDFTYKEFFRRYILKYIIAILFFGYMFSLMEVIMDERIINLNTFLISLKKTIIGDTWEHMWYLYTLIGVLLFIPLFNKLKEAKEETINYMIIILFISSILYPVCSNIFNLNIGIVIPLNSVYLLYALLGYKVGNKVNDSNLKLNVCGLILSLIMLCIIYYFVIFHNVITIKILANYNSPIILLETICLFNIIKQTKKNSTTTKFEKLISQNSYGIYIFHMFSINILYKLIGFNIYGRLFFIKSIFAFIITFIFTNLIVLIAKKMPYIKNII